MPFRRHARITVENRHVESLGGFFYAITFPENEVPDDAAYFHTRFRRTNPLPSGEDYLIVDGFSHGKDASRTRCGSAAPSMRRAASGQECNRGFRAHLRRAIGYNASILRRAVASV
jgi:hypothetical protein